MPVPQSSRPSLATSHFALLAMADKLSEEHNFVYTGRYKWTQSKDDVEVISALSRGGAQAAARYP